MEHILLVDGRYRRPTVAELTNALLPEGRAIINSFESSLLRTYSTAHTRSLVREALKFAVFAEGKGRCLPGATVRDVVAYLQQREGRPIVLQQRAGYLRIFFGFLASAMGTSPALVFAASEFETGEVLFVADLGPDARRDWEMLSERGASGIAPDEFFEKGNEFVSEMESMGYSRTQAQASARFFRRVFVFLVANGAGYSPDIAAFWIRQTNPEGSRSFKDAMTRLGRFGGFLEKGRIDPSFRLERADKGGKGLPDWFLRPLGSFLDQLEREGHSRSSVNMHRVSCIRFGAYLTANGIAEFSQVTPQVVMSFHVQDEHASMEGKNAYGSRIRSFLDHLADEGVVREGLSAALPNSRAVGKTAVATLSDGELAAIGEYREGAASASELRDVAIVMLGLRTGLRGIDIVNLRLQDIDWTGPSIAVVQQKTLKSITLPLPTDAANSLYLYITKARPAKAAGDNVFVAHRAPYGPLSRRACPAALSKATGNPEMTGFHITRKPMASRMMASAVPVDVISDVLGHSTPSTVSKYLCKNERLMRECALPLSAVPLASGGLL